MLPVPQPGPSPLPAPQRQRQAGHHPASLVVGLQAVCSTPCTCHVTVTVTHGEHPWLICLCDQLVGGCLSHSCQHRVCAPHTWGTCLAFGTDAAVTVSVTLPVTVVPGVPCQCGCGVCVRRLCIGSERSVQLPAPWQAEGLSTTGSGTGETRCWLWAWFTKLSLSCVDVGWCAVPCCSPSSLMHVSRIRPGGPGTCTLCTPQTM